MKVMNEIQSDVAGEIIEVLVEDRTSVEYGQTLFKIRKS
jgi:biotin carboxyl carrier protein